MVSFGMPTLIENRTIYDSAELCNRLGLQFVELNMNLPQYQLDRIDVGHFRDVAKCNNIYYTIHLDENLNVSDFNSYVANSYRRTVMETIDIAKQLGVPVLNMHIPKGVYFTLPDKRVYLFDEYKEQYLESIEIFANECESAIGDSDIVICVENCDGYTDFQLEALDLMMHSRVFRLTFDIGHNHGTGGADEIHIMRRLKYLCHMHMHDASGRKNHLALGTGEIDLQKYLAMADENNCRIVLETKTIAGLEQSVQWITRNR